jgi:DNA-binding MarR family transcriptional regulator
VALTVQEKRVERLATRYSSDPINLRLLRRLWLTASAQHRVDDLARALNATPAAVRRALGTLAHDGLVEDRGGENGTVYIVAGGLSANVVVGQLIARLVQSPAAQQPA